MPLAIFTHGSDVGRNQLKTWSFATEAHRLRSQPEWAVADLPVTAALARG
jgi:hypothetical protein